MVAGCLGVGELGVGRLDVGGLDVGRLGAGELGMGVEWANCRYHGLSHAMALLVARSVERSLRFSAFLGVRPKSSSGHPIGRDCTTQPTCG